ncbi:calcium:sodium antiporter [Aureococcus anophagefferens]|uniref:Calcium:sodium antiporter n=1 Tax=Aureococcus anophagefferens TaxID=44056 RepID=A0ABR1FPD7_AURAN
MGNSVGDLVADTATATHLSPQMAVASCFGSPLLNDILGRRRRDDGLRGEARRARVAAERAGPRRLRGLLLASLLSSLAAFPALGFFAEEKSAARRYPYALFGLYGAFALVSCLVELDVVIPQDRICALGNGGSCLRTSS